MTDKLANATVVTDKKKKAYELGEFCVNKLHGYIENDMYFLVPPLQVM